MQKFIFPLVVFAAFAVSPAAQAQAQAQAHGNIIIEAPRNLTVQNERDWNRLKNQNQKIAGQLSDREKRVTRERANITRQQRRVADAQKRLSREQSRLDKHARNLSRELSRLQSDRQDFAQVQDRMIEMGGVRAGTSGQPR